MKHTTFNLAVIFSVVVGAAIGISAGIMKHAQTVKRMATDGPIKVVNSGGRRFYQRCDKTGWCINAFDKGNLSDEMIRQRRVQ